MSLASVLRLTDEEAEKAVAEFRWPESGGRAVCPHCNCPTCYEARRPSGALRFRCKACRKDFSLTSGTLFASHKLPLRVYLAAIVIFCNEVKGKSALALSRDLDVQYKTAFVLAHKLREAMATELKEAKLGGEGRVVELDGAYFGGYIKPANLKSDRVDRRQLRQVSGNRRCVVVARERDGKIISAAFSSESEAVRFITGRVAARTEIMADEATSWNPLHARFVVKRINHQLGYSMDGASTNGAESFFSRMRRAEQGHHHHIAGPYLARYAQESAWREEHSRVDNGSQVKGIARLALNARPSVDFSGYWQRAEKLIRQPST